MPRIRRVACQTRAEIAPHTPSHTTSFRHPVHSDLLWKHRDSHSSLLSNLHIVPRLPRDWAIASHLHQHFIAKSNHALLPPIYLRTQKFQCNAMPRIRWVARRTHRLTPLAFATPCTQIYCENTDIHTLPYFQTCTLSHACHVTELVTCELPLDYSTTWLSYCELLLDYSTTWLSYCELPLDYSTTWLS